MRFSIFTRRSIPTLSRKAPAPGSLRKVWLSDTALRAITIAVLLAFWQASSWLGLVSSFALPPPTRIIWALGKLVSDGFPQGINVLVHVQMTFVRIIQGFALGAVTGIPLGLFIGRNRLLERAATPIVTSARSIAPISLLPLAVAWFGVGELEKVLLIFWGTFWAVITSTIQGAMSVDPNLIRVAKILGTSRMALFFRVVLPATLPRIFAGLKIALGLCFMIIIAVEMVGTLRGLGALIQQARVFYRADLALAGTVLIGAIGYAITLTLDSVEKKVMPWNVDAMDEH
jgi:ABC-type nitrate/sulfonate/bicarbonate transport system permease component